MARIIILPLSIYLNLNETKVLSAAKKLGISAWSITWRWFIPNFLVKHPLQRTVNDFKKGMLAEDQFIHAICQMFSVKFTKEQFLPVWNSTCNVTPFSHKAFAKVAELEQQGDIVYFFSATNTTHIEHISNQLPNKKIPGRHLYSYEAELVGFPLITTLMEKIKVDHPGAPLIMYYTPPGPAPYSHLGWFAWIWAPMQKWFHRLAVNTVRALKAKATAYHAQLIEECKVKKHDSEIPQLTKLEAQVSKDQKDENEQKVGDPITPLRHNTADDNTLKQRVQHASTPPDPTSAVKPTNFSRAVI